MSNTNPLDLSQGGRSSSGDEESGPATNGSAVQPSAPSSGNPTGAQAVPPPSGGVFTSVGTFFTGLRDDWRKEREFKREMKRAQLQAQQGQQNPIPVPEAKEGEDTAEPDLLQQERQKRIRMISDFTDVKETLDHRIKRYVSSAACAVVPWLLVIFLTSDVGEYFAGQPFNLSDFKTVGIFGITALLEIVIAVVTNAWGNTIHDMNAAEGAGDKTKMRDRARSQAIAWAVLSTVSGFALFMFLMQQNADNTAIANGTLTTASMAAGLHAQITWTLNASMINVILRVIGTLTIDPACVFAVHTTSKNLDQFLKQQAQVTTAITQISDVFDKQQEAAARAEMRQKENERFLELKSGMDTVNAQMMQKMGDKLLEMSDTMFEQMQLPATRVVEADDDDGRNVRRIRR